MYRADLLQRQGARVHQKLAIAKEAAKLVENGDSIAVEAGTTTALIARFLLGKQDVRVISNSLLVLPYMRTNALVRLSLLGGVFSPSTESLVGPTAVHAMEQFRVRYAFVGTDGFDVEAGCTTNIEEGAEVLRTMCRCAQHRVLLADSTKYGKPGFVKTTPVSDIDIVITDDEISMEAVEAIVNTGPTVIRAGADDTGDRDVAKKEKRADG